MKLAQARGAAKHGELMAWLKSEHGLTHGNANLIALRAREATSGGTVEGDALVDTQYAGPKAALRPLYDKVIAAARGLGADVAVAPKKGYVSLRRRKQFALVQPSTATRLDLVLVLNEVAPAGRLRRAAASTPCIRIACAWRTPQRSTTA